MSYNIGGGSVFMQSAGGGVAAAAVEGWVRPADWLALPTVSAGDKKLVGLYAVYDTDSNFIAVKCRGAYTVDWGDGSAPENVADNTQANHIYDRTVYAALAAGTLCSRGYKQVIVTITPQGAGTLTSLDLSVRHTSENQVYQTQWLDIKWASAVCTTFALRSANIGSGMLEQCTIVEHLITNYYTMFNNCYALQSISIDTTSGTNFSYMFANCMSLQVIPLIVTSSGTNFSNMFYACSALKSIPLIDTSSGTNFGGMFQNCYSLQSIPLINVSLGTYFVSMFSGCGFLQSIPLLNMSSATAITTMFASCLSLQRASLDSIKCSIAYTNCRLSAGEIADMYSYLYDFREIMTINVSPTTDWVADDVITGQASGKTCTIVSKIDATHYIVKTRVTGNYTDAEQIGVTGDANKLADQNAGAPTFAPIEVLVLDVAPATTWAAGETITGTTSTNTCVIVDKISNLMYSVKDRSGAFTLGEVLSIGGARTADQGAANPIVYGRGAIAGVTAPTVTITGNWGVGGSTAVAVNKGWTVVA